ncbi:glycosyl transferase, partial [Bacillus anthracis]
NKALLLQLKRELDSNVDSVMMHYHILFDDKDRPTYSVQRNRLVKRKAGFKWVGFVHEFLDVYGNIMISDISIHHKKIKAHTDRNLMIFRKHIQKGTKFSPRELFYYGNELFEHSFFVEALKVYKQFLQKEDSWIEDQIAACIKMANCYAALYDTEMQLQSLLWSLRYDKPRAEICCRLGITFLNLNDVEKAIFWYELALTLGPPPAIRGLIYDEAAWSWLPHLQLCVCYDQKGDFKKALYHNNQALKYRPDHPSIIH